MSDGWAFVVLVLVIFVALAPRQVLGPVFGALRRYVGPGVSALIALGAGAYVLHDDPSGRALLMAYGLLAFGALCAAWWGYRRFVPLYREQAPASEAAADDR